MSEQAIFSNPNKFLSASTKCLLILLHYLFLFILPQTVGAQNIQKEIPLPMSINGINQEFSGLALEDDRLYLLPQYGGQSGTKLNSDFVIYSIAIDSILNSIEGKDSSLLNFNVIQVRNLDRFPDSVTRYYQGFEAIVLRNDEVFLSMETNDRYGYCFVLKGELDRDRHQITLNTKDYLALKKPSKIPNAGFESLAYSPVEHKLLAVFEFNGIQGGTGYLVDTSLKAAQEFVIPHLPFRITDIQIADSGTVYGTNCYWNGDYRVYGQQEIGAIHQQFLGKEVPDLKTDIEKNPSFLKDKQMSYGRIVKLNGNANADWEQLRKVDTSANNWEGIVLFGKGALIITDANNNSSQRTTLAYIEF
jgi:hypothetical protein